MFKVLTILFIIALVIITPMIVAIVLACDDPYDELEEEDFRIWCEEYQEKKRKKKKPPDSGGPVNRNH